MEMSKHYRTRYVNQPFAVVNHDAGDNLSNLLRDDKLEGDREYHGYMLSEQVEWARSVPMEFLKSAILFLAASRRLNLLGASKGQPWTFGPVAKVLLAIAWPISLIPLTRLGRTR